MAHRGASGRKQHRMPILCMWDHYGGRQLGAETRGGAYIAFYFFCSLLFGPIWPELRSTKARAGAAGHGPRGPTAPCAKAKRVLLNSLCRSMSGGGDMAAALERGAGRAQKNPMHLIVVGPITPR